jgi:hypothetical protein
MLMLPVSRRQFLATSTLALVAPELRAEPKPAFSLTREPGRLLFKGDALQFNIREKGYVTGVEGGSFHDVTTGFRDLGFGLDIVDWIMEPGSDEAYRDKLPGDLPYVFNNEYHGTRAKRCVEGPQICTQAKELQPKVVANTPDLLAIHQEYVYKLSAPGKKAGSKWEQTLVFPKGKRYFLSADRITSVNSGDSLFLRIDMPGHIKHKAGDSFSEIYLSYLDEVIPAKEFTKNFAPDEKFLYVRNDAKIPKRLIRAYHIRDPKTGKSGPWLAGMTLDPAVVSEGWCHQRGYVCMIEEVGGRKVEAGSQFGAAYIVGFFDSIDDMHKVYDQYRGHQGLTATDTSWKLTAKP